VSDKSSLHELLRRTGNGDTTAFELLYDRMRQPLCDMITWKYRTLTQEDAEDVVQNAFIKISLHADQYQGIRDEASAKGWMRKIVLREALKVIDMNKRLTDMPDDENGYLATGSHAVPDGSRRRYGSTQEGRRSVEEQVERKISLDGVLSSARKLSAKEQSVLNMRFEEERTFEEIGREIHRTKPRAKQIVDGIVAKIRKSLGGESPRRR
jgi:RNA polymerase sigma factor (sigma-70 family)